MPCTCSTVTQPPCTALMTGNLKWSSVSAVQGDCQWPQKNGGNSHQSYEPTIHCNWVNPNLYLEQPITKGWCQPIRSHASYHTDSPTATRMGLCSSLTCCWDNLCNLISRRCTEIARLSYVLSYQGSTLSFLAGCPRAISVADTEISLYIDIYSEKAWACVQNGITQRGRLADGDMTTSLSGRVV